MAKMESQVRQWTKITLHVLIMWFSKFPSMFVKSIVFPKPECTLSQNVFCIQELDLNDQTLVDYRSCITQTSTRLCLSRTVSLVSVYPILKHSLTSLLMQCLHLVFQFLDNLSVKADQLLVLPHLESCLCTGTYGFGQHNICCESN